ncbi:methyltransferase domain-containing protein [bacterium]|nr:methyltransferase domain-containing protein [bacterium]
MDLSELAAIRASGREARRHPWELSRANFVIARLAGQVPEGRPLLDVGCGDAYMLGRICQAYPGRRAFGVDTAYREDLGVASQATLVSSLDQLPKEAGPAGLVLLMDVLEHVSDPAELIGDLVARGLVDSQTLLFVTVPAWQVLYCKRDHWLGHYRRYRVSLLKEHLSQAGILTSDCGYFFASLILVRAVEVVLERLGLRSTEDKGLVGWRGGPRLLRLLSACLNLDAWLCRTLSLPGLTCYALGRLA